MDGRRSVKKKEKRENSKEGEGDTRRKGGELIKDVKSAHMPKWQASQDFPSPAAPSHSQITSGVIHDPFSLWWCFELVFSLYLVLLKMFEHALRECRGGWGVCV